jgi:hypothetical protein
MRHHKGQNISIFLKMKTSLMCTETVDFERYVVEDSALRKEGTFTIQYTNIETMDSKKLHRIDSMDDNIGLRVLP